MELQYGGIHLCRTDLHGRGAAIPSWLSKEAVLLVSADTGNNGAGNGGDGYFTGSVVDNGYAAFEPGDAAKAGTDAAAEARQPNSACVDQAATQVAGVGGDGGNLNAALGGNVGFGLMGAEAITSGGNGAGNGGDGHFAGAMIDSSAAVFDPVNIAVAGHHAAHANQSNAVYFDQSVAQIAGVGGQGGNGNVAMGGGSLTSGSGQGLGHDWVGSGLIATGGNSAGNGGEGYFSGSIIHESFALYDPINIAIAGSNANAEAVQTNDVIVNQSAFQMAGIGGQGGDGNAASGGNAASFFPNLGAFGSDVIATGGNSAGNGGEGYFSGSMVHESFALYDPINIAIAGSNAHAQAVQANHLDLNQSAFQTAGIGGQGGAGNAASGGNAAFFSSNLGAFGSHVIATGGNSAGNGGEGYFSGSVVHESFALYDPINIAIAGSNANAQAVQTNNVNLNQSAFQMAGIGGHGGDGNAASGGNAAFSSSHLAPFGSDVIPTGGNSAGDGGNGHFSGAVVDLNIAIYAPINIAVAGYNSSATADQANSVHFDQGAVQIAGIGGNGGHGNLALGGDLTMQFLADHHFLSHAA